jgi:hypothetical protein
MLCFAQRPNQGNAENAPKKLLLMEIVFKNKCQGTICPSGCFCRTYTTIVGFFFFATVHPSPVAFIDLPVDVRHIQFERNLQKC